MINWQWFEQTNQGRPRLYSSPAISRYPTFRNHHTLHSPVPTKKQYREGQWVWAMKRHTNKLQLLAR